MTKTTARSPRAILAAALAVAALLAAFAAAQASAALRHFDGPVLSKDAATQTFRVDTQQRGPLRFHTNAGTEYERIAGGFSGLERGMRVEVSAKRSDGHWLATVVERKRDN